MKLIHYINKNTALAVSACLMAGAALAMLSACKEYIEVPVPVYTVGEAANPIVLSAGISEGGSGVQTRAVSEGAHVPFSATTQMRLYVEGTWTGKTNPTITQYTNCITSAATSEFDNVSGAANDTHPLGSFTTQLYWDDYGTADPNNATNRANGLKVFGVAVDGLNSLPSELSSIIGDSWTNLLWSVNTDGNNVLQKDLVVSNNHGDNSASDKNGIKFTERTDASKNILEYKHMMSKVTFVLTASDGFSDNKFTSTPEVVLTRNEYNQTTESEYCYTSGTVDIKTATATGSSTSKVTLQHLNTSEAGVVTKYALIYPGSDFGTDDAKVIARIEADGNIYYVTAEKIRNALSTKYGSSDVNRFKTRSGINYIISVNVKKTKIEVTATIKDWDHIESADVYPVIKVDKAYGSSENNFGQNQFSFYRSTSLNNGYSSEISTVNNYYPSEATVTKSGSVWNFSTPLYWTNHNTHYQMRGVWPPTVTTDGESVTSPRVETSGDYQVIKVQNVAYVSGSFPSDLAIGRPDVQEDSECTNQEPGHTKTNLYSGGICATEGKINLAFEYMMSKIEVNLSTSTGSDQVELANAVVEVTNLYNTGDIRLGDRTAVPTGETALYTLTSTSTANQFMNAIVPQTLTCNKGAESNVRFKITITNNDEGEYNYEEYLTIIHPETITEAAFNELPAEQKKKPATKDVYYADVATINKKGSTTEKVAPNGKWESGKYYVYSLKLSKTKIDVTATLADWIPVTAEENVWF